MFPDLHVRTLDAALAVLTSMITPALLISASGTFILSTSTRLGRVVDRARKISEKIEELLNGSGDRLLIEERRAMFSTQMDHLRIRASKLQRSLTAFYLAAAMFVLTSVAIGVINIFPAPIFWIPVVVGIGGALFLLQGSLLLITEARLAVSSLNEEMDFLGRLVREHAEHPERPGVLRLD